MMRILRTLHIDWICDNVYVDGDVKVRDHCHITGTYTEALQIESVI